MNNLRRNGNSGGVPWSAVFGILAFLGLLTGFILFIVWIAGGFEKKSKPVTCPSANRPAGCACQTSSDCQSNRCTKGYKCR